MKRPNSAANLVKAIKRYCGVNQDDIRLARVMADVIVGQMLPGGVVKGGSSLMFRYGGAVTRYTKDVDTARSAELEAYLESLRLKLAEGCLALKAQRHWRAVWLDSIQIMWR